MDYSEILSPTTVHEFSLSSGKTVRIPMVCPKFVRWQGAVDFDDYGGKKLLNFEDKPTFAELLILRCLEKSGWQGVWVDTFRSRLLVDRDKKIELPRERKSLLDDIRSIAKTPHGCFDVFSWKGDRVLFAESKQAGQDQIRDTQVHWLESALRCGLTPESFLVVEWSFAEAASK